MISTENNTIKNILASNGLDGDIGLWQRRLDQITKADVKRALDSVPGTYNINKLLALISPAAESYLEQMAQMSQSLTIQRFGRTMKLYAPLYLSSYCSNSCLYCGFNTQNKTERKRLTISQAIEEAKLLAEYGFSDVLLVSSEDKNFITVDYLTELAKKLKPMFSSISVEIYQMTEDEYKKLFCAGIEGVTLYQETYNRDAYRLYHRSGSKADFDNRLQSPDNFAAAGMREIGIGVLLGLADWRLETLALARHGHYLMKKYWKSRISFSFPRLRPASQVESSNFEHLIDTKSLTQMIIALRLCFADASLVLSTREPADIRNNLIKLGITKISAGSKTNPGGYADDKISIKQFQVNDNRSPAQIAQMIRTKGMEPVFKDWDKAFTKTD
ncbi:MAG: 2-iminoacetate synthase ThiH [Planctomycetes bacterium]|nr:2-iminoacetate synthase ThiH [Planctomycetota bacterium]